jgi:BON domain
MTASRALIAAKVSGGRALGAVQATVDDGVVTLTGRTAHRTIAFTAARLTEAVPGVSGVVDRLTLDVDDTAAARAPQQADRDPLRGWLSGHQPGLPRRRRHRPTPRMGPTRWPCDDPTEQAQDTPRWTPPSQLRARPVHGLGTAPSLRMHGRAWQRDRWWSRRHRR